MKTLRPLFFFSSLLLIVGLACSALGGGDTPAQTEQPQQPVEQPTQPPTPTEVPPTAEPVATKTEATKEPESNALEFFKEEFDSSKALDNWDTLTVTGSDSADPDKVTVESKEGKLVWDFDSEDLYYYLFYNAFEYEDVQVDIRADNRGRNNNSISMICRYDPEVGWYEFNIANSGLYDIFYAEVTSSGEIGYNLLVNGGSNSIKQGREVNEYSIICKGDQLTLTINGDEVKTFTEKKYGLRDGQIGISVSSFNVLPILIEMDWVEVSEP